MKNIMRISIIGIGACILLVGISLVILKTEKPGQEEIAFENQLTDSEKEDAYYGMVEKFTAKMLNRTFESLDCEVDIDHAEGKIVGVSIDAAVSEDSVGNDALKTDISDCISRALNVTGECIAVSVH